MRPVLLGQSPGKGGFVALPASSPSVRLLAKICDMPPDALEARYDALNVFRYQKCEAGRDQVRAAVSRVLRGRRVIALGAHAEDVLRIRGASGWTFARDHEGRPLCVATGIPHPSGLNHLYNSPETCALVREVVRTGLLPCIHVEGPDGAGKTYLTNVIAKTLSLRPVFGGDRPKDPDATRAAIVERIAPGLVADRSSGLVSELVYGRVLRGATQVPEEELWDKIRAQLGSTTWVYCRGGAGDEIQFRDEEPEDFRDAVRRNIQRIRAEYEKVFRRITREGGRVVYYDRDKDSIESVMLSAGAATCAV